MSRQDPSAASMPVSCGHCGNPMRGYATAYRAGSALPVPLCHPDDGMDCYHLVTVYQHPMPCEDCAAQVAATAHGSRRCTCGHLETFHLHAPASGRTKCSAWSCGCKRYTPQEDTP
jgi:hypothetical protein